MTNSNDQVSIDAASGPRPLTGYHVAAMIVAFFGVIITVNFTMAWLASSSWTGLVVKNSYVASQQYNGKIAAARQQKSLGWQMKFGYSDAKISFVMTQKDAAPVLVEGLQVTLGRPVSETKDTTFDLVHVGQGRYEAETKLGPGIWGFQLNSKGETPYYLEGRFFVSKNGMGSLE